MSVITADQILVKHSTEVKVWAFNFTPILRKDTSGALTELLTGTPTVTATTGITVANPAVNTTEIVRDDGSVIAVGAAVTVKVSGGTASNEYVLTCTAASDDGVQTHVMIGKVVVE